jgi:hypothetical protein
VLGAHMQQAGFRSQFLPRAWSLEFLQVPSTKYVLSIKDQGDFIKNAKQTGSAHPPPPLGGPCLCPGNTGGGRGRRGCLARAIGPSGGGPCHPRELSPTIGMDSNSCCPF